MATTARAVRPGPTRPEYDLGIVDGLVQLSTLVQALLTRVAAGADLSLQQGRLLGILRDREPTMAQLARFLDLDRSSTTGLVDRATQRGLVRRMPDPDDGRSFRVVLTDEGRRLTGVLETEVTLQVSALTDGLSETNRHRLSLLAGRVVAGAVAAHGLDIAT
jgi:DNA-binding MarR family transcriptional regulator